MGYSGRVRFGRRDVRILLRADRRSSSGFAIPAQRLRESFFEIHLRFVTKFGPDPVE